MQDRMGGNTPENASGRAPLAATLLLSLGALSTLAGCNAQNGVPGSSADVLSVGQTSGDLQIVSSLPEPKNRDGSNSRRIHRDDLLTVDVFQVDSLDRTVRVDEAGTIDLPFVGTLQAAGRSVAQLERDIETRYGADHLQDPEVSVFVKASTAQSATLDGAFVKPGSVPVTDATTLLRLVAAGGGLTRLADEKKVFVFRKAGTRTQVWQASIAAIREGRARDPHMQPGDLVVAFDSRAKVALSHLRDVSVSIRSAASLVSPL